MTRSSKAKMFLSDERGVDEEDSFRSYHTFNFGKFFSEHKIPFGDLYVLNDDSLAGGYSAIMTLTEDSYIILLPVVGAINYKDNFDNESLINAGEIQVIVLPAGADFEISNPYDNELVNYLQFRIRTSASKVLSTPAVMSFDLVAHKNSLIEVANVSTVSRRSLVITMGQFRGREEAIYGLRDKNSFLFVFVIEGAFEILGRLIHPRDGLALWDLDEPVDMEALSNEAVIMLMEVGR